MKIEDLKNVKLSKMTAGYLAIHLKLSELYKDVAEVTELNYSGVDVDNVTNDFCKALGKAGDEIMKLAVASIEENLWTLNNRTEI